MMTKLIKRGEQIARERQRQRGESDEQARAENRRAQSGLKELQHYRGAFRISNDVSKTLARIPPNGRRYARAVA